MSRDRIDPADIREAAEERERKRIVTWLRAQAARERQSTQEREWSYGEMFYDQAADGIESGEHLKDEPSRPSRPPGASR